ncbi:MAG: DUF433 domain-containing protein [Candidatus Bathyarchaeia archaeon]
MWNPSGGVSGGSGGSRRRRQERARRKEYKIRSKTIEDILKEYPELTREDVQAALEYISKILRREIVAPL